MGASQTLPEDRPKDAYWARPATALLAELKSGPDGLSDAEAQRRLAEAGPNRIGSGKSHSGLKLFFAQFRSPLVLILIFAALVSASVGESHEAIIIMLIVLVSCLLGFSQEYGASRAMEALRERLSRKATVVRDGREQEVNAEAIVPGDVVMLSAGALIPADCVILDASDFNVSEAVLTGETFPAVKSPGVVEAEAVIGKRSNITFTGTSVRSGTARVLAVRTGETTEFAAIAGAIEHQVPETDFARGIRRFGYLMTEVMLAIVIVVFAFNLLLERPLIDSLLFSLALAVGLTPELLPAIISVTLSRGARTLAQNGVIIRRLEAIENLGSMDLLCTDKTGTLTKGVIHLDGAFDASGAASDQVLVYARLNATLQSGMANPLDEAIAADKGPVEGWEKIDEVPYDFVRKQLSVAVRKPGEKSVTLISKGAVAQVLDCCTTLRQNGAEQALDEAARAAIDVLFRAWSEKGFRVLAVASRQFSSHGKFSRDDEQAMALEGFLLFFDPPKEGMRDTLAELHRRGIAIKVISGDNRYVARHLAGEIGLKSDRILTGEDIQHMSKDALFHKAPRTDLFVEIDPNQKERIIHALKSHGHVVGYMGDGINDAPALHEADIGISVDGAVDVAREAADIILLKQDLGVLVRGVDDGRRTFANTMKYISITTSANFGNMISMAFASLFLPFLPLLAKQILLNNFLSDLPSLAISTDNVDPEDALKPRRWDIGYIRRFMVLFGLVSSAFDFLTFGFLILIVKASEQTFQTAWFIESLITELLIVLVVRTARPFWQSRPSRLLMVLTAVVILIAVLLPALPFAGWFGFTPLPVWVIAGLGLITLLYVAASEAAKHLFHRWSRKRPVPRRTLRH